ncbi:MAG: DUF1631 family protein [Pseudomonadota bacterium]
MSMNEMFAGKAGISALRGAPGLDNGVNDRHRDVDAGKKVVERELKLRIAGQTLPTEINILLNHAWKEVLLDIYLEEGSGGMRWQLALEITEELLWSLAPKTTAVERKQMAEMLPLLVKVLRQGLSTVITNKDTVDSLMAALRNYHMESLRGENIFEKKPAAAKPAPVAARPVAEKPAAKPQARPNDAVVAGPYCQIEMLNIASTEETASKAKAARGEADEATGWVYRAATNEWVFVGETVAPVARKAETKSVSGAKTVAEFKTRKMDEGDK